MYVVTVASSAHDVVAELTAPGTTPQCVSATSTSTSWSDHATAPSLERLDQTTVQILGGIGIYCARINDS
jgi:hypothetical protein